MSGVYNTVIESVKKVIDNRKARSLPNDKMSLIKFDDDATIEILNKSINDEFKVSSMSGGGTTFLKPLKLLTDILMEIDYDVEIPVVLFLSDGQAESKNTVVNYINENVLKSIKNPDWAEQKLLFFAIGYGNDADKDTLEAMVKTFNNGSLNQLF